MAEARAAGTVVLCEDETVLITFAWLPTACPELNPVEALWRDAKQRVSANRAHADMDGHAADFAAHVDGHTDRTALRLSGVSSGNFWLTT